VKVGGITLCTDNFTLQEVNLLISALANKFDLDCSIHKKKGKLNLKIYNRIYLKKAKFDVLKKIFPYSCAKLRNLKIVTEIDRKKDTEKEKKKDHDKICKLDIGELL
jgi:hypothetical protein